MLRHFSKYALFTLMTTLFILPLFEREASSIELVQSIPLETDLAVDGVRHTKDVWQEMFKGATKRIDLEQFYISEEAGKDLTPILQTIEAAAERGVEVRLIADRKFFALYPDVINKWDAGGKIKVRIIDFSALDGVQHAKFFIVDGREFFIGSANFDWRALSHIHEIGLRVQNKSSTQKLQEVFDHDWESASPLKGDIVAVKVRPGIKRAGRFNPKGLLSLTISPPKANEAGLASTSKALTSLMKHAKKAIEIQVMEYSVKGANGQKDPWHVIEHEIQMAAKRGVKVSLLVDKTHLDKGGDALLKLAHTPNVSVKAVTIPEWSGGKIEYARLIHSKYMLVDRKTAWVGTENWSQSYFENTRNVGVVTRDRATCKNLGRVFDKVFTSSYAKAI
jgi:phosphatidylserine/phosphatidylglycerophosphate/cardiolipin synthase-like enzyme